MNNYKIDLTIPRTKWLLIMLCIFSIKSNGFSLTLHVKISASRRLSVLKFEYENFWDIMTLGLILKQATIFEEDFFIMWHHSIPIRSPWNFSIDVNICLVTKVYYEEDLKQGKNPHLRISRQFLSTASQTLFLSHTAR